MLIKDKGVVRDYFGDCTHKCIRKQKEKPIIATFRCCLRLCCSKPNDPIKLRQQKQQWQPFHPTKKKTQKKKSPFPSNSLAYHETAIGRSEKLVWIFLKVEKVDPVIVCQKIRQMGHRPWVYGAIVMASNYNFRNKVDHYTATERKESKSHW